MGFEVYRPRSSRENVVALTKHHIRLGRKLADKLNTDRVEVAYDKDTKQLRVKGVKEGGMMLNKNKIGARGIFKYFNIEDKKGNFAAEYNEKENAIYVNLKEVK
ncbi:hypothetical protein [Desulfoscipio geothermicus]|uniref:Uncharacterized protein n=1 Tax=Desulfoscipio geothermicus DSM 3669 TaxID=1121426 RepID=A0A1I6DQY7_9FIRM|nr:hypothetical protein [Desulfoscipio geothermicus]SFR07777.1 hypothetical protein SAMN05660706_11533 [Desulfoscipio geothermicus DSM 3669]